MRRFGLIATLVALTACGTDVSSGDTAPDAGVDATQDADIGTDTAPDVVDDPTPGDDATDADPFACRADELGETSVDDPAPLALDDLKADLTLCEGESDWFVIEAPGDADVTVVVDTLDDGALAVELARGDRSADGEVIDGAVIATIGAGTDPVIVRLLGAPGTEHIYSIVATATLDPSCPDRADEPNDDASLATPVDDRTTPIDTWICAGDEDWYRIDLAAGEELVAALRFAHDDGDLELELLGSDGTQIAISESGDDDELVASGPLLANDTLYIRVWGFRRAAAAYVLDLTRLADDTEPATVRGSVRYEDRVYNTDGFTGELPALPARSVVVEVVRESDGVTVATGTTDAAGAFEIDLRGRADQSYTVRALAAVDTGAHTAVVRDRTRSAAIYAVASEPIAFAALGNNAIDLLAARSDAAGGALNIADVVHEAFVFIERWVDPVAPELTISWQPGMSFSCGSCYSRDTISLGGQLEDPDEYDDDIVLHEFGHYFVSYYSADSSPGGSHRDRQVQPTLAYGEGLAYFFVGLVRDNQHIVDNFLDARRWIDMEAVTQNGEALDVLQGTTTGDLSGNLREELVSGVLWDAYDPPSADEPFDTVELGADGHMRILLDYFGEGIPVDVGPRGIDLSDWLNALVCTADTASDAALALADDREFPWTPSDVSCDFKHGVVSPLRLYREQNTVWVDGVNAGRFTALVDQHADLQKFEFTCDDMPCSVVTAVDDDTAVVVWTERSEYVAASWVGNDALMRMLGGALAPSASRRGAVRIYPSR